MAEEQLVQPGSLKLDKLEISTSGGGKDQKVNIANLVTEINIYESLYQPFTTMDLFITDASSLFTLLPMAGEEVIDIEFSIPDPAFLVPYKKQFRVVGIHNVEQLTQVRTAQYVMRCIEPEAFNNWTRRIRKAYMEKTIKDMAVEVFNEFFDAQEGELDASETKGKRTIVVPNFSPVETMYFFAREAQSEEYAPSNFTFYSDADGYHFKTIEELIKEKPKDKYILTEKNYFKDGNLMAPAPGPTGRTGTNQGNKPAEFMKVIDWVFGNIFDLENNLRRGAFDNTVFRIDPNKQIFEKEVYSYTKDYKKFWRPDTNSSAPNERGKYIWKDGDISKLEGDSLHSYIISNYASEPQVPDKKHEFLHLNLASVSMLDYVTVDLTVPGDPTRRVGDIIEVVFPEFSAFTNTIDKENVFLAGGYLVVDIRHMFNPSGIGYTTIMRCVKNNYYKSVDEAYLYLRENND